MSICSPSPEYLSLCHANISGKDTFEVKTSSGIFKAREGRGCEMFKPLGPIILRIVLFSECSVSELHERHVILILLSLPRRLEYNGDPPQIVVRNFLGSKSKRRM